VEPNDTKPDIEAILIEGYRRMTPQRKLECVIAMNCALRDLAAARIRAQYGEDIPERELRLRLASLYHDRDTMVNIFGWDPEVEGY